MFLIPLAFHSMEGKRIFLGFEAVKAAALPGGGVAYSVGVRAMQKLDQEGVFS